MNPADVGPIRSQMEMYKKLMKLVTVICLCLLAGPALADTTAVTCALQVDQISPAGERVALYHDTVSLVPEIARTGFAVSFSIDIELADFDSTAASFMVHVVTLGPPAKTLSRRFRVEYGLPALIDSIPGKNSVWYALTMTPVESADYALNLCPYDHHKSDGFTLQPTAHMDIHFLRNSLGDFYYGAVKGVLEASYREFKGMCWFNLPGKYHLYLCPCLIPSVVWDKRFGMSGDPTRSSAQVLFTKEINAVDPFVINHPALLRNWGYAPAVLSEGLANYGSLPEIDIKRLGSQGKLYDLEELLRPGRYRLLDPFIADRCAAGFVRFLVNRFGLDRLRGAYERAHDLNLVAVIESEYGMPLQSLQTEFRTWVDTVRIQPARVLQQADMAEAMFRYGQMREYAKFLVDQAKPGTETRFLPILARALFNEGDYYEALEYQMRQAEADTVSGRAHLVLATYQMAAGEYDSARQSLLAARRMDPDFHVTRFNLALSYLITGDTASAQPLLEELIVLPPRTAPVAESAVLLANILRQSLSQADQERARDLYRQAQALMEQALGPQPYVSTYHMWAGLAAMGQGLLPTARDYLEMAAFLETRAFYRGMISLSLGQLSDLQGEHDQALHHYREVLSGPYAAYHQDEARRFSEEPFRQ